MAKKVCCDHAGKYVCCSDCSHNEEHPEFSDCATKPISCAALASEFGEFVTVVCKPMEDER